MTQPSSKQHSHTSHHLHHHGSSASNTKALKRALTLTAFFMIVELVGGYLTRSMALISDGLHMSTDAAALALSLGAFLLSKRPPSRRRTFGYYRLEVLAAFANGVILIVLSILVIFQSWQRFKAPVEIRSLEALGIAIVGLAFNLLTARELLKADHSHINIRGAFIHVLSDTLGSIGAIIAMALTSLFNWAEADAIVSASIGLMILFTAWRLISETTNVMLEGAPEHLDSEELRSAIQNLPGIDEVHDLHLWCLSSNQVSFSAHVVSKTATENCLHQEILVQVQNLLKNNFGIQHSTIQIESENMRDKESTHP